jgi:hypothetical protein
MIESLEQREMRIHRSPFTASNGISQGGIKSEKGRVGRMGIKKEHALRSATLQYGIHGFVWGDANEPSVRFSLESIFIENISVSASKMNI